VIVFQIVFCLEMHQNKKKIIFKKLFLTAAHQNDLKISKKY